MFRNLKEFSLPAVEEKVLAYWRANRVFEASLAKNAKKKRFVFYEGPPTANGRPGIHHVLARAFKDIIPRYKTMRGFHVPRRGGWDTHGLPVEIEVEKALGLKSKKEIEKYGIAAFNAKCKESVWKYKDEWEKLTERMGFWLDMDHPYVTYENRYMEAVWGILKEVWKKKLLYRGHKVVHWCTRCGTTLASHEVALGYDTVEETSVYVKFYAPKLKAYILSWTTTPWTLPGNVALAINPKTTYVKVKVGKKVYILAKERLSVIPEPHEIVGEMKGKDLIGVSYEPLFDVPSLKSRTSYKVYPAHFVTIVDGTGVVHTAVMYGEDDYQLGMKVGLPARHTVDEAGKFTKDVKGFAGMFVKAAETEKEILDHLTKKNLLYRTEKYSHEYPFCWRCQTPLLYYARDSWFIAMSKLRGKLLSENKKINWVPAHLREGRFGEWLREVKDWAISRARYWGTPLPIWQCEKCDEIRVIGDLKELEGTQQNLKTKFVLLRHGEAENNTEDIVSCFPEKEPRNLTLKGRVQIERTARALKKLKPEVVIFSDLLRTKQTAQILHNILGTPMIAEKRIRETNFGDFNGGKVSEYTHYFASPIERFTKRPPRGETLTETRAHVWDFLREAGNTYSGKTVVVVSHGAPIKMMEQALTGMSDSEAVANWKVNGDTYRNAEWLEFPARHLPRNETGLFDLHRPYVDDVTFPCAKCKKGTMKRIPEVLDVWFDSGAMPFAGSEKGEYPADYIAEAMDQTRGWFYTLLAIGVLMGKGRSYKNVISLGLVLDKNGQKMSKSKGNVVDPWGMMEKYGVDAVRWYLYTVNPAGEPKKFDESEVGKALRQFLMMVYNSWFFYETYAEKQALGGKVPTSANILDKWVLARLEITKDFATKALEKYEVGDAARVIEAFAGDLSRWYIRRSRRRLQKPESDKDYRAASATLGYVLMELAKLMAPFTPFFAEALYLSLIPGRKKGRIESVHLEGWPKADKKLVDKKLLAAMEDVRQLASLGLAKRAEKGIKVRQPLASLKLKTNNLKLKTSKELLAILADEVNVKKVAVDAKLKEALVLNTEITHELLEEGWFRELVRTVQGMRQDAKLTPTDVITVHAEVPPELAHVIRSREKEFMREVNAKTVEFARVHKHNVELQTRIGDWPVWLAVKS